MKCISLWQPWATAIALGSKRIETRSWATAYRGPLLIHAAKRLNKDELICLHACWNWIGAMHPLWDWSNASPIWECLPFGAIVARCILADCKSTGRFYQEQLDKRRFPEHKEKADLYAWTERQMGDFSLGRFGWVLEDVEAFETPIPFRGRQQLFDVPEELLPHG